MQGCAETFSERAMRAVFGRPHFVFLIISSGIARRYFATV